MFRSVLNSLLTLLVRRMPAGGLFQHSLIDDIITPRCQNFLMHCPLFPTTCLWMHRSDLQRRLDLLLPALLLPVFSCLEAAHIMRIPLMPAAVIPGHFALSARAGRQQSAVAWFSFSTFSLRYGLGLLLVRSAAFFYCLPAINPPPRYV